MARCLPHDQHRGHLGASRLGSGYRIALDGRPRVGPFLGGYLQRDNLDQQALFSLDAPKTCRYVHSPDATLFT